MKRSVCVATLVASAAAIGAMPALASHSWGNYHWPLRTRPLALDVVTATTSAWETAVARAISDWNTPVVSGATDSLSLRRVVNTSISRARCRPVAGKVVVCNYPYGRNGWLGIASLWTDGSGHITQATTKLNDSYYGSGSYYNTSAWRSLVTCQEIGHDFGLDHQDEAYTPPNLGTCMDYTDDADGGGAYGPSNTRPNLHDYQQLASSGVYGHTHSSTLVQAALAAAPADEPGDGPADWGRAVEFDRKGRPDVFVRDLGRGQRKITHVFWLPREERGPHRR